MTDAELFKLALTQINAGIAAARKAGVVCGPVISLSVAKARR